jgi:hypothetical protein
LLNKIGHVTTAERYRARAAKSESIEQIEKKWPAKNWRKRLRHIIHYPAQPRAEPANEYGYIDAGERESWGNSHAVISEDRNDLSPKTLCPK